VIEILLKSDEKLKHLFHTAFKQFVKEKVKRIIELGNGETAKSGFRAALEHYKNAIELNEYLPEEKDTSI
jgi:prefoldin subunit 5